MRLLKRQPTHEFRLVEFPSHDIPPYAILSHTWGADEEEVTFRDISNNGGKNKSGYGKIRFCAAQARKDGLEFFWIDSCCIDRSSSAELSEAINSMFRWYENAAKCYVYLSDVSTSKLCRNKTFPRRARNQPFQSSKWFTRSWTLQELLAPASVQFFSQEGTLLGDKAQLVQEISEVTKIPVGALRGMSLSLFSVNERMSWARGRNAKREEDTAYSLLGIFNIHMPLIYGEGRENAFARLRKEINQSTGSRYKCAQQFIVRDCAKQFNAIEGTQINNTGNGNLIYGSFNQPVRFG